MEEITTFEEGITELERIVASLEGGELPLEQAVELFQKGKDVLAQCTRMLDEAEAKIAMSDKE